MAILRNAAAPFCAGMSVLLFAGIPVLVLAPERLPLVWLAVLAIAVAPLAPRDIVFAALIASVDGQPAIAIAGVSLFALSILEPLSVVSAIFGAARFYAYAWLSAHLDIPGELSLAVLIGAMAVRRLRARR